MPRWKGSQHAAMKAITVVLDRSHFGCSLKSPFSQSSRLTGLPCQADDDCVDMMRVAVYSQQPLFQSTINKGQTAMIHLDWGRMEGNFPSFRLILHWLAVASF
mmetsp:Transcript_4867/g.10098  ORF Transcript_4867/g.10098 Transcript_4867/m.10098 type:complete len:103 (+) Transcript_4867:687-995(+)